MKFFLRPTVALAGLLSLGATPVLAQYTPAGAAPGKKLIEFGWGMPNTEFLSAHIVQMEQQPFDGVVFSVAFTDTDGTRRLLHNVAFGKRAIPWASLESGVLKLKATRFYNFTENFLRVNLEPGNLDWFDDFTSVRQNFASVARIVSEGGVRGIFLDLESYQSPIFDYTQQLYKGSKTFAEYQSQVRLRSTDLMNELQKAAPGLTVFLPVSYEQALGGSRLPLSDRRYGLLPAFVDGLFASASGKTVIVDGFESAYGYDRREHFDAALSRAKQGYPSLSLDSVANGQKVSAGFPVWMDYGSDKQPWNTVDFTANKYPPAALEQTLVDALSASDRYVWVYSQQPKWWTSENLPGEYVAAVRHARERLRLMRPGDPPLPPYHLSTTGNAHFAVAPRN